jgi:hypothetical protein
MSHPPPKISSVQNQNLAKLSRAQSHDEAVKKNLDAMGQALGQSFVQAKKELDRSAKKLEEQNAWFDRHGHWLARLALLPILALAIGVLVFVVLGLWSGEIKELQKYSKFYVTRNGNPSSYWASVIYHSALAAFIAWVSVVVFRAAKIGRKNSTR